MQSTGYLDKNVVKNRIFTPPPQKRYSPDVSSVSGGRRFEIYFYFRFDHLKVPLPLPLPPKIETYYGVL